MHHTVLAPGMVAIATGAALGIGRTAARRDDAFKADFEAFLGRDA